MTIVVGGVASQVGTKLLDVWEGWDGYHNYSNNPIANGASFSSSVYPSITPTNLTLINASTGGTGAVAFDLTIGRAVQTWPSGAAYTGKGSGSGSSFGVPIRTRFALAGSPPLSWVPKPRRFRIDYVARITIVGTADFTLGWGIDSSTIGSGNNGCVIWQSRPAINAGRWMPRHRDVTAGALIDGPDSGISPAAFHRLSLVYEEGTTPRVRWLLDDREVFQLAGDAAMPQPPAGMFGPFLIGCGLTAPAGTTVQMLATHFSVDEL